MDDFIVMKVCSWAWSNGYATARFNFRGSFGWNQTGAEDTARVARALLERVPANTRLILAGYSYGSILAAGAAGELGDRLAGIVLISPPLSYAGLLYLGASGWHLDKARNAGVPVLLLLGTADQFCSVGNFESFAATFPTGTHQVVDNTDHFWRRRNELESRIQSWVSSSL